ncbi:MAG: hypothetical protein WHV67_09640, partial [Thermoanaerobaculia bacterium]
KTREMKKIGNFPLRTQFYENFILFSGWNEKAENRYLIGFKKQGEDTCFTDRVRDYVFLKEGVFYKKIEEGKNRFYYADYKNFEKKLAFEGEWQFHNLSGFSKRKFNTDITYWFLFKDRKYFKIKMPSFEITELGNLEPFLNFDEKHFLIYEKAGDKLNLYLFKNEEIIKKVELDGMDIWSFNDHPGNYKSARIEGKNGIRIVVISLENENLKIYYLPENTTNCYFLKKDGELIILKEKRIPFFKDAKYRKAYLYNFKTGKERSL